MPTTKESERYFRFNKSVTLFKANEEKYITLQLFLLKKLPKVYRIKSSNIYRAIQGYIVTEGFLNRKSGILGFVVSDYYQTERLLNLVSNKVNKWMIKRVISCWWETSEWSLTTRLAEWEIDRASESLSKLESQPIGVIEIWLSKVVIEILSERMPSKFVSKLIEWVIIIRERDYLIGWATWELMMKCWSDLPSTLQLWAL